MSTDKPMSSRLLTMKFMQRAAATSGPSSPRTPGTPSTPPSKRQRLSTDSSKPRYSTDDVDAIRTAIAEEELKTNIANERRAAELGETRWVLSVHQPSVGKLEASQIQEAGFGDIDSIKENADEDEDSEQEVAFKGRMTFGRPKTVVPPPRSSESSSEFEDEDEDDYDPLDVTALINEAQTQTKRSSLQQSSIEQPSRISNGGAQGSPLARTTCHKCGGRGHLKRDCPN